MELTRANVSTEVAFSMELTREIVTVMERQSQVSPSHNEPMVQSSHSSSSSSGSPGSISYLPPYLIGGSETGSSPGLNDRSKKSDFAATKMESMSSPSMGHSSRKPGPPVQQLFDEYLEAQLEERLKSKASSTPIRQNHDFMFPDGMPPDKSFGESGSFTSLAQMDPFYTQGEQLTQEEQLDESWITVYGFPPVAASYILLQFSQYGTIIEHKVAPYGNWIHIHYQMKMQAKKALSKNGKVFGGSIMVGVKPCVDLNVMHEDSKENSLLDISSGVNITRAKPSKKNMRPLTLAYRSLSTGYEVIPQNNTPQKNDGFVSTALEYLLNW